MTGQAKSEKSGCPEVGSDSLEAAARFAVAVLDGQVMSQGREWDPKLTYTASKYLRQNLEGE